ncbi:hypothetical protein Hanom_Chr14g01312141 [Helianthus anomalus]
MPHVNILLLPRLSRKIGLSTQLILSLSLSLSLSLYIYIYIYIYIYMRKMPG